MNEIFHYLKFKNLSKNCENYVPHCEKWNFEPIGNPAHITEFLTFWCLYKISDVLSKQKTCEMKALRVEVYIQQWFHDEQGAKLM